MHGRGGERAWVVCRVDWGVRQQPPRPSIGGGGRACPLIRGSASRTNDQHRSIAGATASPNVTNLSAAGNFVTFRVIVAQTIDHVAINPSSMAAVRRPDPTRLARSTTNAERYRLTDRGVAVLAALDPVLGHVALHDTRALERPRRWATNPRAFIGEQTDAGHSAAFTHPAGARPGPSTPNPTLSKRYWD